MGITRVKASPRELDCLLFIYKAYVREDVVSVKVYHIQQYGKHL